MIRAIGLSADERAAFGRYRRGAVGEVLARWRRSPAIWLIGLGAVAVIVLATLAAWRWWSTVAAVVVLAVLIVIAAITAVLTAAVSEVYRSPYLAEQVASRLPLRRLPGASSHRIRSPRVGAAARRIELGYHTAGVAQLEHLATSGRRGERLDALVALGNAALWRGEPRAAVDSLDRYAAAGGRWSGDALAVGLEAVALLEADAERQALADRLRIHLRRRNRRQPDRILLAANVLDESARLDALNEILVAAGVGPLEWRASGAGLERFTANSSATNMIAAAPDTAPLISVLVALHNNANTIQMALDSLMAQRWPNFEIIVVDAASTDGSAAIVEGLMAQHAGLRLVRSDVDLGVSGSLRLGLESAAGTFITTHAPDRWAHPDRLAHQIESLLDDEHLVATVASMVRITPEMCVVRADLDLAQVIGADDTSLMVRRTAFDAVGGWDAVHGDTSDELVGRLQIRFGPTAIVQLAAPLTVAPAAVGVPSVISPTGAWSRRHVFGARRCYDEGATNWRHGDGFAEALPIDRRSRSEPFFAPAVIHRGPVSETSQCDVLLVSDFALPGGTTASNLMEITVQAEAGLRTGLLHHRARHLRPSPINDKVRACLDDRTGLVTLGDHIDADLVVVKYPPSVYELPDMAPAIRTGTVVVVANQAPWTSYDKSSDSSETGRRNDHRREVYRIADCNAQLRRVFGVEPIWIPVGPVMRSILETHHGDDWAAVRHADTDWVELIDPARWARSRRPTRAPGDPIVIGRHGRDSMWKWPTTPAEVFAAYPDDPAVRVEILGGADLVRPVIGRIPSKWVVHEFDAIDPATFLAGLDVFVNFVHPEMVEAFGRTILEALAVGVPVITDLRFQPLFGDAVIGCTPAEARTHIDALLADPAAYDAQVARGRALVAERFGPAAHLKRLAEHDVGRARKSAR